MSKGGAAGFTVEESGAAIKSREIGIKELAEARLTALDTIGRKLNAVARLQTDDVLAAAGEADENRGGNRAKGSLYGVSLAHKDIYARKGWLLEAGSRLMAGHVAERTSFACAQLDKAGALDLGRLNTVEFALGTTGHNSITGNVRNPWNPDHITGGSSNGSAAAVAAGLVPAALGSDTGGSVRLPAAACGLVGLKPTFGLVGRSGVVPLSHSLDTVGPLTRTVRDAALILQAIAGYDPDDAASVAITVPDYLHGIEDGAAGLRIGVPENYFFETADAEIGDRLNDVQVLYQRLGAKLSSVTIENIEETNRLTTLIIAVEGAAAHSRWLKERALDYSEQTLSRLLPGLFVSAEAYVRALEFRKRVAKAVLESVFDRVDLVFTPVWTFPIPTIDETDIEKISGFSELIVASAHCTRPVNFLGFPSISVPCGFTGNGLPMAFQLIARPFEEGLLLRAARAFERAYDFSTSKPRISVWS